MRTYEESNNSGGVEAGVKLGLLRADANLPLDQTGSFGKNYKSNWKILFCQNMSQKDLRN